MLLEPVIDATAFFFSPVLVELPVGKNGGKVNALTLSTTLTSLSTTLLFFDMSLNSWHCGDLMAALHFGDFTMAAWNRNRLDSCQLKMAWKALCPDSAEKPKQHGRSNHVGTRLVSLNRNYEGLHRWDEMGVGRGSSKRRETREGKEPNLQIFQATQCLGGFHFDFLLLPLLLWWIFFVEHLTPFAWGLLLNTFCSTSFNLACLLASLKIWSDLSSDMVHLHPWCLALLALPEPSSSSSPLLLHPHLGWCWELFPVFHLSKKFYFFLLYRLVLFTFHERKKNIRVN